MFVVDTNVLISAAIREAPGHALAAELMETWRRGRDPWHVTWSIAYEFFRVSTHRAVYPNPLGLAEAVRFLGALLESPSFGILAPTERHYAILNEVGKEHPDISGSRVHDMHIAVLMREHGITEIRTADADFRRFKFLKVVNPLA